MPDFSKEVKEHMANFFGFDVINLNEELEKGKDLYTAISILTGIPRKQIKNYCHPFMYGGDFTLK